MQTQEEIEQFIKTLAQQVKNRECSVRFALIRVWQAACVHTTARQLAFQQATGCNCGKHHH